MELHRRFFYFRVTKRHSNKITIHTPIITNDVFRQQVERERMIIEDEVNNNRSSRNPDRNTQSQDDVNPHFLQEQIARVFTIWSDISRLPTVGPSFAYSQYSRSRSQGDY